MTTTQCAPVLEATGSHRGARVALKTTHVEAALHDLLARVTLTQVYVNEENTPIEAVYTFALPLSATLLDLSVRLGERELTALAVEKSQAEERYEDAMTDGDTAVMLQEVEPGLYSVNVGNLLPGETAAIRLGFAQVHRFLDDHLRFHLPTTLAPRYGSPEAAGLQPHQAPETVLDSGLKFSLQMRITGALGQAELRSPSHDVAVQRQEGGLLVSLARETAPMDRDFVLLVEPRELPAAMALCAPDMVAGPQARAVLAAFLPRLDDSHAQSPLNLKILVDCSGSMGGDSIAQAREALLRILDSLRPGDFFSLTLFGSGQCRLFESQTPVNGDSLELARDFTRRMDADMGGTELLQGLQSAFKLRGPAKPDLLLITDGEVWDEDDILGHAERSGHRIFTVGVGSSVSEALVQGLARRTGGACELVTPNEAMADKIFRHFQRMHLPPAVEAGVSWPVAPDWQCPEDIHPLFPGDTLAVHAGFKSGLPASATLRADFGAAGSLEQNVPVQHLDEQQWQELGIAPDTVPRIAARERIRAGLPHGQALQLALDYDLLSPHTHLLLVDVREEERKSRVLPALRTTPHTLAAGWGASGSVSYCRDLISMKTERCMSPGEFMFSCDEGFATREAEVAPPEPDTSAGKVYSAPPDLMPGYARTSSLVQLVRRLALIHPNDRPHPPLRLTIADLEDAGLPPDLGEELRELIDLGADERVIVAMLLHLLLDRQPYATLANTALRRLVRMAWKTYGPRPALEASIKDLLDL